MKIDIKKVKAWNDGIKKLKDEIEEYTFKLQGTYEERSQTWTESNRGQEVIASIEELEAAVTYLEYTIDRLNEVQE